MNDAWSGPVANPCADCAKVQGHRYCTMNCSGRKEYKLNEPKPKEPAMTTSDLDPDALATLIVGMVRRGTKTKADGICRAAGPMVSFEEWATDLISSALHEAEQRGQEAMREKAAKWHDKLADKCRAARDFTMHVHVNSAKAIRALTAREPGVTGKPRCRFYGDDDRANHDCHINMALAVPPCKGKCDWKEPPGVTGKGEG